MDYILTLQNQVCMANRLKVHHKMYNIKTGFTYKLCTLCYSNFRFFRNHFCPIHHDTAYVSQVSCSWCIKGPSLPLNFILIEELIIDIKKIATTPSCSSFTMKRLVSTATLLLVAVTCVAAQYRGTLEVRVNEARIDGDGELTFLKISAFDDKGNTVLRIANYSKLVDFGEGTWSHFEVKVLEKDKDSGDITIHGPVNASITPGQHIPDRVSCGAGCVFGYDYTFTPKHTIGKLTVYIETGHNLKDADSTLLPAHRGSDAYVKVTAMRMDASRKTLETAHIWNRANPTWNKQLDFGVHTWTSFEVQVFDKDLYNKDDALSPKTPYNLNYAYPTSKKEIDMKANGNGRIKFRYSYQ